MSGFGKLCRTIRARERLIENLASAERQMALTPWYRVGQRRDWRRKIASRRREIADRDSKINAEEVHALANNVARDLWASAAADLIPKKNTHGPAARERFDDIIGKALELRRDHVVFVREDMSTFPLSTLPEVRALVTRSAIESHARGIIDDRAAIAASTELIHLYDQDREGRKRLWIQHAASGVRALFILHEDGFGGVNSGDSIGSIDPAKPGPPSLDHLGLGIGRRIYEEAHRLEPGVRWGKGAVSDYSGALRRKLHAANPYIWAGPCAWCNANLDKDGIHEWRLAPEPWFNAHP